MKRKILIVEDEEINRRLLSIILSGEYELIEAADGGLALELIDGMHTEISAVLLDLVLPVVDGFAVLRHMRENADLSQIPVIVTTGSSDVESEVKALSLGANDYVTKPYNPALIRHCLRNTINLRETASIVNVLQRDKLTGLYNREAFFEKAASMIREQEPGYYVMSCFDINNFKLINDQYGTAKGDSTLQCIGAEIRKDMDGVGGIASRISADNFAALYPADSSEIDFVTRFQDLKPLPNTLQTTTAFSVGCYTVTDTTLSASAMYDWAYMAKQSIKGRYDEHIGFFDETMRDKLLRSQEIIGEMDLALANRQFEVWFQPQFNHSSGALVGAEALARWRHPEKGLIQPGAFIPVFEQNGFIYELDKYIWAESCRYLRKWLDEGRAPLPVSVNISRYDVFRPDLIDVIVGLTEKYNIPIELLRLEITESAFAHSAEQIISVVKRLMERGFVLEIDDFGSGYSSLNTLKDVPANVLKLDMRFLENNENSQRGGNILESIVRMAKWLDMAVIAEGVETRQQADFLKSIGCNYVQGYLYARPMTVEAYESLAKNAGKEERLLVMETVEHLDNDSFWDPKSMDTLIFNSFVGGACIFEYNQGFIELLRANDKYAQVIGSAGMTVEDALKLNWREHLDEKNSAAVLAAIDHSVKTGEEVTDEFVFHDLPGCPKETYLRSSVRVIASSGTRCLVYCTNENMTAQRQAEERERRASERMQAIMDNVGCGITAVVIGEKGVKYLFANDRYYDLIGYTRQRFNAEVGDPFLTIHPEDREMVQKATADVGDTGIPTALDYRILRPNGNVAWLRSTISMTSFNGVEGTVQLCIYTDVTSEKRSEQELGETDAQLRFLNDTAHDLLSHEDIDKGVENVLWKLLDYFGGNRVYIFEFNFDKGTSDNTYEVCAEGVRSEKDNLQNVPMRAMAFWIHAFDNDKCISIADITALDESRAEEKRILGEQGIKSLIAVPLHRNGALLGFIGVDDPGRQQGRVDRLDSIGDYIAVMLNRRELNARIRSDNETLMSLMNDTPGGFVRMRVYSENNIVPVYMNNGFCKLMGMSRERLMELYGEDAYAGVHPDDVGVVREAVAVMLQNGEAHSSRYRLVQANGEYLTLMIFGRMTRNESGEVFLNIYYSDTTEQEKLDAQRGELLDNLPCGASLFELDNGKLTVLHLNKRYTEMVGRESALPSDRPVMDAIHPSDRAHLMSELASAIDAGRDAEVELRILCGDGSYRSFHVVGRIVPREDGRYSIYAAYTPISDEAMSYSEMLPVVLAAVMTFSGDMCFVKDRNHRYICASRSFAKLAGVDDERSIIGMSDHELVGAELANRYQEVEREIIESGKPRLNYEEMLPDGENGMRYVTTSKFPLLDSSGNVIAIYCITRDVTEYHTAFERLKLLTDNIPGGIAAYTCREGDETPDNSRITYFNDGFCALFGYTREEYESISRNDPVSLIYDEDRHVLNEQYRAMMSRGESIECVYRVHVKGGGYKWIKHRAVAADRSDGMVVVNAALFDVTEEREASERLRVSEEEYRMAMQNSGSILCRFSMADKTVTMTPEMAAKMGQPELVTDVPEAQVSSGLVSPATAEGYIEFFNKLISGEKGASVTFQIRAGTGWRWVEANASTVFSASGVPVCAVISIRDVTEQLEKEAVYAKWQQSMKLKKPDSYTLFRCNLSKDSSYDTMEGSLLNVKFKDRDVTFNDRTREYVEQCVYEEDWGTYMTTLNSDALLAGYYRGKRTESLEYREKLPEGGVRWLKLSIELVEYPSTSDVEAYLMYENINERKCTELMTIERAETDALTGVLNRTAFSSGVEKLIRDSGPDDQHALMMLDIDGFKLVNDVFGHAAGDQALMDIAASLKSVLRRGDMLGRMGGDEFVLMMSCIPNAAAVARKARQICAMAFKSFSAEVQVSVSVGVAISPADGTDFNTLYKKADAALYHVKGSGKNGFAFYREEMRDEHLKIETHAAAPDASKRPKKRRMLIVDDNNMDHALLSRIFVNDFIIEKAKDGPSALIRLRHYGTAISVVLLDLMMPGMSGFEVLKKMQDSAEMQGVPVVVVSGENDGEVSLRAIRSGASDFVTKPVDPDLLRARVMSAISKAENERLRAQNSYLEMQNEEVRKYRTVMEHIGLAVVEYDWVNGIYCYDEAIGGLIAGTYDDRTLWHIFLSDMVADAVSVKDMQTLSYELANDRTRSEESVTVKLKTPAGEKHRFRMNIYKQADEFQLTNKLIFTFADLGGDSDDD